MKILIEKIEKVKEETDGKITPLDNNIKAQPAILTTIIINY